MREKTRDKSRIVDIVTYSENVTEFVKDISFDDFVNTKVLFFAVMKNVEIVGEAAYMLSKEYKDQHPNTPWNMVQGMRHVLVHDYATVIPKMLWNTATKDIPILKKQAIEYLNTTDWDSWEDSTK